jgi:uroporphyrinogen III methyltransferase/synthase
MPETGRVYLIGAGPGDPGLLTLKGLECIRRADVIVYDRLVHPALLAHARSDAELIYVGKASSAHTMKQDDINRLLVDKAKEGKTVARLKGGDPFVFGRGGEEAEVLVSEGIEFEVVPGVTSAIAAPAYAGIPVTHRGIVSSVGIITGHERSDQSDSSDKSDRVRWDGVAKLDTIVFLMGVENLPNIVAELVKNGRDRSTPVALVRWGTRTEQETLVGTLGDIVETVRSAGFKSPAVTIVGEVVKLREKLRWFDNRPLFGKKVLVTRSRDQASELSELLRQYGAEPVEFPVIKISPPESFDELDSALDRIDKYDWLLFTSANGVRAVVDRLQELGRDVRWLKGPKVGAIGPKTADAIQCLGVKVDFVPKEFVAEAVVREFPDDPKGKRILIPRAKEAREVLPEKLMELGAQVDVVTSYKTEADTSDLSDMSDRIQAGEVDIITFTSSSTVKMFAERIPKVPENVIIACIGPITAETAESLGLKPNVVAEEYTIEGLVEALVVKCA